MLGQSKKIERENMTLVYTVIIKRKDGEVETLLKDGGKEEAFSIVKRITGYKESALVNRIDNLHGVHSKKIWNRRNIIIEEEYF